MTTGADEQHGARGAKIGPPYVVVIYGYKVRVGAADDGPYIKEER